MEFEYFEHKFPAARPGGTQRIDSILADHGYQSLRRDAVDLVRRYLPNAKDDDMPAGPPAGARTIDVLVPASSRTTRIVVCERPAPDGGTTAAVIAVGRSHEEARRGCTGAKLTLKMNGTPEDGFTAPAEDGARGSAPRFRDEWARALGLQPLAGADSPAPGARAAASPHALIALQGAPTVLGRPGLLRSRLDKGTNGAAGPVDAAQLDGLAADGLVDRSFVLVCRESSQIVGVGKDSSEVQAAMQLSLRCPHCRRPLSEESHDVVYSLSSKGEDFLKSAGWIRAAVEAALRKRNCDAVFAAEVLDGRVHAAASYKDAVLLFRLRDGTPSEADVRGLQQAGKEFGKVAPGVPVRTVIVATQPGAPAKTTVPDAAPTILVAPQLDDSLDRLLDEMKRDTFARLSGTALELVRTDPNSLLR
ncbi:MAG TPA: hypothetical protein VKW09_11120 [bacterium]|nr:hypothetical protein [bacterium]